MARTAKGWTLGKRKPHHVRFTHAGRRYDISTKSRDPREAAARAARIYSDVVEGRLTSSGAGAVHPGTPLSDLCALWIDAIAPELGAKTGSTYTVYAGHWIRHYGTLGEMTTPRIGDYQRKRLLSVQRSTVVKERSAKKRFLLWLEERGHIKSIPSFPALPKKALGTKHKQGRSKPKDIPTVAEVQAVLNELSGQARAFHVALYEQALRPVSTLRRLVPADVTPFGLHIRPECDKNRWERTVPLTDAAREALSHLPFTEDHREAFKAAVKRALGPDRKMTPYTLRHARITHWRDAGVPDNAIRFLSGTRAALGSYNHPSRGEAEKGLELWCRIGAAMSDESAKGGNRTRKGVTPLAPQASEGSGKQAGSGGGEWTQDPPTGPLVVRLHQNPAAAFRAKSAAWFRRGAA